METTRSGNATHLGVEGDAAIASSISVGSHEPMLDLVLPDLHTLSLSDLHQEGQDSRAFYKWLDAHWGNDEGLEQSPPTRFLLDELDERGARIQKLGLELEQVRERLLEREVQIVRLERDLAERQRLLGEATSDADGMGEKYRKALQAASDNRRIVREQELEIERLREQDRHHAEAVARLHAQMEQLMGQMVDLEHAVPAPPVVDQPMQQRLAEAEARIAEVEALRRIDGDHYREVFGEKDSALHALEARVAALEAENAQLHAEMKAWPMRHARSLGRMFGR